MTKLTFIADTHYYNKTLGITGRQYFSCSGSDRKCLAETGELINAVFNGSVKKYSREDNYYKLVLSVVSIPSKIIKDNNDVKKLIFAVDAILTGGRFDNQRDTI